MRCSLQVPCKCQAASHVSHLQQAPFCPYQPQLPWGTFNCSFGCIQDPQQRASCLWQLKAANQDLSADILVSEEESAQDQGSDLCRITVLPTHV